MDANYYLQTISTVFQDFKLVNGTWDVKGVDGKVERVRPMTSRPPRCCRLKAKWTTSRARVKLPPSMTFVAV
jgi:hypothetical protein